ncbi:NAD-dependent isocitrate dehydrogenase, partial [bacterium]
MEKRRIAIVPGDGIGPEIMDATLRILGEAGFQADYEFLEAGQPALDKGLPAMPQETLDRIREIGLALKGPTATPIGKGHTSANVALRKALDLFVNVRPSRTMPGVHTVFDNKK